MKSQNLQVLIAGAGPTGLALACDLARRGVQYRIIDKAHAYFNGSRGKGLQPRTLEVFDDLGIVDEILSLGQFHLPFRGYEGEKVLGERDPHEGRNPTPNIPYASPLIIPQFRVEERLRALLERSGGRVELATELVSLEQDEDGVTATLQGENGQETVRCQYLFAADGGRSFVRKFLDISFEGETWKEERMYVADVGLTGLDRDAWHAWANSKAGFLALCPLPSTDLFQFQAMVAPGEEREPSLELFREIVRERTESTKIELTETTWMSLYRPNVRMISQFRVGRVFLGGDAAHVHSPAGGQGMNTGIQDGYNFGWKLKCVLDGAPETFLDSYEEERLPVAASVLGLSTKLHRQMSQEGDERIRRDGMTLQLGITYKEMSLSRHAGDVSLKVSSGDRAPDAPGQDASGAAMRLFDVFRGPHFTLLRLFLGDDAGTIELGMAGVKQVDVVASARESASEIFVDSGGHVLEAYGGGNGELLLVRPDGYVGWIGPEREVGGLRDYLRALIGR